MNADAPVTFRAASVEDVPLLQDLAQKTWRVCYPGIISTEQIEFMLGWMYSDDLIRRQIVEGVAWEVIENGDGEAAGFLSYHSDPDNRVKLEKLYVLPVMQGRGIGKRALAHVLDRAKAMGANSVWMQVNKQNEKAIASYRKAGFIVAREAVFDIGGGFVMDDYLMEKTV